MGCLVGWLVTRLVWNEDKGYVGDLQVGHVEFDGGGGGSGGVGEEWWMAGQERDNPGGARERQSWQGK